MCTQRIVPGGMPEMTFYLGDLPAYHRSEADSPGREVISGQQTCWYDIRTGGRISLFSILFRPEGLKAFFRLPPHEILNNTIGAEHLMGKDARLISERLSEKTTIEDHKKIIENYLMRRLNVGSDLSILRIVDSVRVINHKRGLTDIAHLADRACLSIRHYERTFTTVTGIAPIRFIRVIRFQNALDTRRQSPHIPLTALAADCGYYDQSHMISEFRKLSGMTPAKFFAQCEPFSDYFS